MSDKWIEKAVSKPGSFTKQAKRSGKSISAEAKAVLKKGSKSSETTKRRANLYETLKNINK